MVEGLAGEVQVGVACVIVWYTTHHRARWRRKHVGVGQLQVRTEILLLSPSLTTILRRDRGYQRKADFAEVHRAEALPLS